MRRYTHTWLLVVLAAALIGSGCKPPAQPMPTVGSAAPAIVSNGPPITDAEATKFGEEVAKAFNEKNVDDLMRLIPLDDLMMRSASDLGFDATDTQSIRNAIAKSGGGRNMLTRISEGIVECKFLRCRTREMRPRPILRIRVASNAFDYKEISLARLPSGAIIAEDVFGMMAGDSYSVILRKMTLPGLTALQRGERSDVLKTELAKTNRLALLLNAIRDGDHPEALRRFRNLPREEREEKNVIIIAIQLLIELNPIEYGREVERFRQLYPNDAAVDLISYEYYYQKKDYAEYRACLQRIAKVIGDDAHLLALQANSYMIEGKIKEARKTAEMSIALDSTEEGGHSVLIGLSLEAKDHRETLRHLKKLCEDCNVTINELKTAETPEYFGFVKSPQFAEMKEWQKNREMKK